MPVFRAVKHTSWARDLAHPLPLAAVGVLAVNDHVLKGAGILPAICTGKISDFAGLFFFPIFLAAGARLASLALRGRDVARRDRLALGAALVTGLGFAAVKQIPQVNALVAAVWGPMVMDFTDLIALPMVVLGAAWMLQRDARERATGADTRAKQALSYAAILAAGLASAATSQAKPPPQAAPPTPPTPIASEPAPAGPAMAVAEDPLCAEITLDTCERTAGQSLVVLRARNLGHFECSIDVLGAMERHGHAATAVDIAPKNINVPPGGSATFALTFLRPVAADQRSGGLHVDASVRATRSSGASDTADLVIDGACQGQ